MKAKSMILAALFVMTVAATFGSDEPKKAGVAVVPMNGAELVKIIYKSETAGKVQVKVYNAENTVVYSGSFADTKGFILPLNLTQVGYGEYKFEITDASGKRTETLVYEAAKSNNNIRIAKLDAGEGKFLVAVTSPKNEKVTVRIFDNFNNLLHNEVKSVNGDFAQVYTVKNLTGTCTFEVSDNTGLVKTVRF